MGTLEQQTVEIRLSKGMVARVCLCHIKLVAGYKWHCAGTMGGKAQNTSTSAGVAGISGDRNTSV